ncbi:hypothetical protein [Sphingomonas endolithica]|uniref:hypothetical protein n=1 Tax=Sphingomonas endolithica TaxID=2972485 RepID=UPI0021AE4DE2|nr:hypothetical protein [Sphingomonas sp. ZFBP2030]
MTASDVDAFWRRQFKRLLALEIAGRNPVTLSSRWLTLASMKWNERRHRVSFHVPMNIYHILDDPDVRAKDHRYAQRQWATGLEWING